MTKFYTYLNESKNITVYHGDNYNTKKLEPSKMFMGGNQQEGVGIYFGKTIDIAKTYGNDIIMTEIDPSRFIEARKPIGEKISQSILGKVLTDLNKVDNDSFYYLITDYGVEMENPETKIPTYYMKQLTNLIKNEEVRNFQIDMCDRFNVKDFVKIWNKYIKFQGTYSEESGFFAVIDPTIKVTKV